MFLRSERFLGVGGAEFISLCYPHSTITVKSNWHMNFCVLERKEAKHIAYLAISSESLQMYLVDIKRGKKYTKIQLLRLFCSLYSLPNTSASFLI